MVEFKGPLTGVSLPALVQLLGDLHESGRLDVWSRGWTAELAFDQGHLVHAGFGDERGLSALDAILLTVPDGEFAFVKGEPPLERTIELSPEDLQRHVRELASGPDTHASLPSLDAVPHLINGTRSYAADQVVLDRGAVEILTLVDGQRTVREIIGSRPLVPVLHELAVLAEQGLIECKNQKRAGDAMTPPWVRSQLPANLSEPNSTNPTAAQACPKLGFADDRGRHYSRPTALHRCYASGAASVVSGAEQRGVCLSGQFATCPRFRSAEEEPRATASTAAGVEPSRGRREGVPPGLGARVSATQPLANGVARGSGPNGSAPSAIAGRGNGSDGSAPTRDVVTPRLRAQRPTRVRLLTAGLLALALVLAAVGAYRSVFAPVRPAQLEPVVVPALATTPRTPVAARATLVAGAAGATAAAQPAAAPAPSPIAAVPMVPVTGQPLVDVRFAAGPQPDWLENPPFAGWSDGAYRMRAAEATHFVAVAAPGEDVADLGDVNLSATFRKTGGPPGGGYGVIIRDQGPLPRDGMNQAMNAYVLEAGDLGEYGVWRREGDHWVDLVPWTRGASVHPGGSPNDLQVRAVGSQITFMLNGVQVASLDDATLPAGGVGVFAGGDFNEVALDRFTVQVPD
jgi:Domain of unknown function (DUF4388)